MADLPTAAKPRAQFRTAAQVRAQTHSAGFPPHDQVKPPCTKPVLPASSLFHPQLCYRRSEAMFADEQHDDAPAEPMRPTHFHDRSSTPMRPERRRLSRSSGDRRFTSGIQTRANARFLSRQFIRAMYSQLPFTNHDSRITNHIFLPGTVNRVETVASHRKQRIGYTLTWNVPVHRIARLFSEFRAPRGSHRLSWRGAYRRVGQRNRSVLLCWRFSAPHRADCARWGPRRLDGVLADRAYGKTRQSGGFR